MIKRRGKDLTPCRYCGGAVKLVQGDDHYTRRKDLAVRKVWVCRGCGASVGCGKGNSQPLGTLADANLRHLRAQAHAVFDRIWQSGCGTRDNSYRWLAARLGKHPDDTHLALFEAEDCVQVIVYSLEVLRKLKLPAPPLSPWMERRIAGITGELQDGNQEADEERAR